MILGTPPFLWGQGRTKPAANICASAPRLVEVTDASGITFEHISGDPDKKTYLFEAKGGGIGALDYDRDGWIDLYIVQGSTVERALAGTSPYGRLYRNTGGWRFEDVTSKARLTTGAWGMGVTAADVDNDGWVDIYLTNLGPNFLYHNNGDGTFTEVGAELGVADPRWSTSASFADYNGDGLLDLFVPNYIDALPDKLPRKGPCEYRNTPCMCGPRGLEGAGDSLYRHNADGTFTEIGEAGGFLDTGKCYGLGSVWGDVDNDGDIDLFVANDATPNALYVNQGDGTFIEQAFFSGLAVNAHGSEQASMGVDLADFENTGWLGAYCTHFAEDYSTLYRNEGDLMFSDISAEALIVHPEMLFVSWGTRFVDLNHDGWKDIFHANGHVYPFLHGEPRKAETYRLPHSLYLNQHNGTFCDASTLAGPDIMKPAVGRGVAFADFDNDGDIDIAVANMNGSPQLFRTDRVDHGHWVMFRCVGTTSNRDGIGARIIVVTGSLRQMWEVKRTVGIYSCSDPRAHFGLGASTTIDVVSVRWPSGKTQQFRDVNADQHYLVDESSGLHPEPITP